RVDFTYFNGTWNSIGSDTSVDGTFTWTPSGPIENVTVRAVAIDEVGLRGTTDKVGVGRILPAVNPPTNPPPGIWQTPYVLAVALLAYGPVSPEQVEFAREMLVQVQDKFEDAIKQRLEEARQEEGRLEARSKELDERGVGIEARGVELDAIQKQANEARS